MCHGRQGHLNVKGVPLSFQYFTSCSDLQYHFLISISGSPSCEMLLFGHPSSAPWVWGW